MDRRYGVEAIAAAVFFVGLVAATFAHADDAFPAPAAVTIDHCAKAEEVARGMLEMKAGGGGMVAFMPGKVAQAFADAWRKRIGAPPVAGLRHRDSRARARPHRRARR